MGRAKSLCPFFCPSVLRKWPSPDALGGSIGDPQSFNRYAYVGNDPVNFNDPLGLDKSGINVGDDGKDLTGSGPTGDVTVYSGREEMLPEEPPIPSGERLPGGAKCWS